MVAGVYSLIGAPISQMCRLIGTDLWQSWTRWCLGDWVCDTAGTYLGHSQKRLTVTILNFEGHILLGLRLTGGGSCTQCWRLSSTSLWVAKRHMGYSAPIARRSANKGRWCKGTSPGDLRCRQYRLSQRVDIVHYIVHGFQQWQAGHGRWSGGGTDELWGSVQSDTQIVRLSSNDRFAHSGGLAAVWVVIHELQR